ncbi:major facilitator superfamily domain-containing protein [Talaromyces proteolyticus]|uniref:Major facilitator superfamily domain-containing protein n=1 Tax=Talaromyces proteolyticus TaxID=1131652 RepID=A0AAD4KPZ3_9EURO|nr:major facilitator superfamily domain-containing protein [Talaromyces proteolyticus]KAH8693569.1 major facilitator superfamily domain-containing protein [Talaromyces proteolyticus]
MAVTQETAEPEVYIQNTSPRPKKSIGKRVIGVLWDSLDDKDPEEHQLVRRLDSFYLIWACFYYFVMYLDSTNISNAYVSGMKEDLGMYGNQLNWMTTFWTIGYIVGTLPSQFIQMRIRPSVWLPTLELIWGGLVMCMAAAPNVKTIYGIRFLVGICEASAYPGMMTLLGNWYTPQELGKRSVIFQQSSAAAQMFSGFLQAGIYNGMNGTGGLKGWRWLFIFDGIISIPIASVGFWLIPDAPSNSKAFYLRDVDKRVGKARMVRAGRAEPKGITWKTLKEALSHWPIYVFVLPYIAFVLALHIASYMNLWLKSLDIYSVSKINVIPSGGYAIEIVTALIFAVASDALGVRWPVIMVGATFGLVGGILLSVWDIPFGAKYFAWYLTFVPVGTGALLFAWGNEVCGDSAEERGILLGWLNTMGYTFNAFVPLYAYPASEAPNYKSGYKVNAALWGVYLLGIPVILWFSKNFPLNRQKKDDSEQAVNYVDAMGKEDEPVETIKEL